MNFPCEIEVIPNFSSFLPTGTYVAVGQQGDSIIIEYKLGWKFVKNCPIFCTPDGKYATIHKNYAIKPGTTWQTSRHRKVR